jgi:hypothetical protein
VTGNIIPVYVDARDYLKPPFMARPYNYDSVMRANNRKLMAVRKAAANKAIKATIDSAIKKATPVKKKHKKFLGIF